MHTIDLPHHTKLTPSSPPLQLLVHLLGLLLHQRRGANGSAEAPYFGGTSHTIGRQVVPFLSPPMDQIPPRHPHPLAFKGKDGPVKRSLFDKLNDATPVFADFVEDYFHDRLLAALAFVLLFGVVS